MSKRAPPMQPETTIPSSAAPSTEQYSFARFWRCALQVNPFKYQAKYRGQDHGHDEDAYNQALLRNCLELGIQVVGIADHGNVESVDQLRGVLRAQGIVVFPGFEITSTEKIHMVCLFDEQTSTAKLNQYLGALGLADAVDGTRPSALGCLDLAKKLHELGGFWWRAQYSWREKCHQR